MIISPIEKIHRDGSVFLQTIVQTNKQEKCLWYSFDRKLDEYLTTESHDGFLVGLLLLAMKHEEDVYVKGKVSEKLYYQLTNYYMHLLNKLYPILKPVRIFVEGFAGGASADQKKGVMTGFSAGIDSFCTLFDHLNVDTPEAYRITHLLFNNVGSHGEWDAQRAKSMFDARYDLIKGFATESGLNFIKVDSNLSDLLNMNFEQTHVPRNISTVLLLQNLIGKFYYASAFRYEDCFVGESSAIATMDPFSIHLLSTESLECISSGCQHSRVEKTRRVARFQSSPRWLNVCVSPTDDGRNCGACWKCSRTLITLEILGEVDKFVGVFDMNKWKWSRRWYVAENILNIRNKDPLTVEIKELASQYSYKFKVSDYLLGFAVSLIPENLYKKAKRLYFKY